MVYSTEDMRALVVLLSIATALPALGVSAALGSISFSFKGRVAPKGLLRRTEVLLFAVSLIVPVLLLPVLWSSIAGFVEGKSSLGDCLTGAALPFGALTFALLGRPGAGFGTSLRRTALVLAFVSCALYVAPLLLYGLAVS